MVITHRIRCTISARRQLGLDTRKYKNGVRVCRHYIHKILVVRASPVDNFGKPHEHHMYKYCAIGSKQTMKVSSSTRALQRPLVDSRRSLPIAADVTLGGN